ncbi:MAG: hypothetical protein M3169_02550 [Candidatus Eremiobacteraeota bacterium]|nr:hypothetical protein [Candidatus Eremiobacteraeota bacterium]
MGDDQVAAMEPSVAEVYKGIVKPDDPPTLCCTLESRSASGSKVWIQVMPGTVNMGYPFATEPLELLRNRCVDTPPGMYLVEWNANEYATFGFENVSPHDHATFVDQLFVRVLGCDDATYELGISSEPLDP